EYPKYESIRGTYVEELRRFDEFLRAESIGPCSPNLCEATYVDHIFADERFLSRGDLGRLLVFWKESFETASLGHPEEAGCTLRWILRDGESDPIGRLYLSVQPAFRRSDERPMFVMESSARGKPLGPGLEGAVAFLDYAHEKLVECFLQITRQGMQQIWKEST